MARDPLPWPIPQGPGPHQTPPEPATPPVPPASQLPAATIRLIGQPPRPLPSTQHIVTEDGLPTFEFHLYMTRMYDWQLKVLAALAPPPPP